MKINTESETDVQKTGFKSRHSLTILLMVIAGVLTYFFLIAGSMSDNRFGTHLVMSSDLTSSPMWYVLTIMYLSLFMSVGGIILFSILYRGNMKITIGQEKVIRIGSLFIVASAAFCIALSSITFAVFNTDFFTNTIGPWKSFSPVSMLGQTHNETKYAVQGVVIASFSIVFIVSIIAITLFFVITKKDFSDKIYYSMRNGSILIIGVGWLVFTINLMAFGAMGGDAGVLIQGVTGITSEEITNNLNILASMDAPESYDAIFFFLTEELNYGDGLTIPGGMVFFDQQWSEVGPLVRGAWNAAWLKLPSEIFIISNWTSNLVKPSFFQGVNESGAAILLMISLIVSTLLVPLYIYMDYRSNSEQKIIYDFSIYLIIGSTIVYGALAWTIPYISEINPGYNNGVSYNPIIDGLINGNGNGLAPGLIAPPGEFGGINGAIVYFSPNYHGTVVWWIAFSLIILVPIISISTSLLMWIKDNKDKKQIQN